MTGKSSRNKGAAGERELLKLLGEELGVILQRNLQQTRAGGADCIELKGFAIEVKRVERYNRLAWWRQACEQAEALGAEPILFYRRSREPWTAWIKTTDGHREATLIEAAQHIRESWLT